MKLDYYEVPFGTEGRTIGVTTVNIFEKDRNIEDDIYEILGYFDNELVEFTKKANNG